MADKTYRMTVTLSDGSTMDAGTFVAPQGPKGDTGTIPEALPQEASALKSGNLPTTGWNTLDEGWKGITLPASRAWQSVTYTISDTSMTANSDVLMELTDKGGVKAYSMEAGKMTVIRDTVPTVAIPYTYKVKQTNASGQFTLVNHFVPSKTSELSNDSGFITSADIPSAGEWQNWSDTSVLTEEGLYEIVTTEYPSDGNKTLFVQYEQGKPNNGACWVSVATANSISVVSPICSGDGTLRVERRLANSSGPADLLAFKYRKIN